MIPIELKKRYPHSREEDITDAFMRGYQACAAQGGDAEMDNCQVQAPQNYMQQSRHNDGTDLISRADAIRWVKTECNPYGKPTLDYDSGLKVIEHLKKMPSELPSTEAEWIPCSERLPEKDDLVLVTVWNDVTIAWRNIYGGWDSAEDMYEKGDVIAWMPLPSPYREDGEA